MKKLPGFTLVEFLIALAFFAVFTSSFTALFLSLYQSSFRSENFEKALTLAESNIQAIKSIRDRNFLDLSSGVHGIDRSRGIFAFSGTETKTADGLTQKIIIEDDSAGWQSKKITSGVENISLQTYLTAWNFSDLKETTDSDFRAGQFAGTKLISEEPPPSQNAQIKIETAYTPNGFFSKAALGDRANDAAVWENKVYVSVEKSEQGFAVVDISDPQNLALAATFDIGGKGRSVAVLNDLVAVTVKNHYKGFVLFKKLTDAPYLEQLSGLDIDGEGRGLAFYNQYVFVGSDKESNNFKIIDISNPYFPKISNQITLPALPREIFVSAENAFVTTENPAFGLIIFDILNPLNPVQISVLPLKNKGNGMDIAFNNLLGLATEEASSGFLLIDISDRSKPRIISSLNTEGHGEDVKFKEGMALIAVSEENRGIAFVDFQDVLHPKIIEQKDIDAKGTAVSVFGEFAAVSTDTANRGIVILGIPQQGVASTGEFTSEAFDAGSSNPEFLSFSFEKEIPPAGNISLQFRTADSVGDLASASFLGPDATSSTFFTSSPLKFPMKLRFGKRFFQYKVFFTSDGNRSPLFKSILINFIP